MINVDNLKEQIIPNIPKSVPYIGLNRTFNKNLGNINTSNIDTKSHYIDQNQLPVETIEKILLCNSSNILKYKEVGGVIVYNEANSTQKPQQISFIELLDTLAVDVSAYDNFIGQVTGIWVDNFEDSSDEAVKFESRFECGNLRMAIKINDNEFDLLLKNDINSAKLSQWFYFKVDIDRSKYQHNSVKFNIINNQKNDTLFSKGLKVLMYEERTKTWSRNNRDVFYFINGLTALEDKKLYTLTFTIDLPEYDYNNPNNNETYYFSYCYPYSYTHLNTYLYSIFLNPSNKSILRYETLGMTQSVNPLNMLLITEFTSNFEQLAKRQCVVLTSRVHPGESNSSFVIQGVIDYLLSNCKIAKFLRSAFIFKIVPMLNPDGVINGNYRACLSGKDLNRMWQDPRENLSPTIYYTKEMIRKTLQSRDVFLFCDFHGHSNKSNYFIYGCPSRKTAKIQYAEMVMSKLLQNKCDYFDPESCTFKIAQSKLKTARAIVRNELNIDFSYCLESSIGFISKGENKGQILTPLNYIQVGEHFCEVLFDLCKGETIFEIANKIAIEKQIQAEIKLMTEEFNKQLSVKNASTVNLNKVKPKKKTIIVKKKPLLETIQK
jgi:murein tripeptide amidase MpaA